MLKNYLKITIRNLLKHKGYTLVSTTGLAVGMAVFLLIALFIQFERSYEDFIPEADNVYRLSLEQYVNNALELSSAENYPAAGPALKSDLPEVEEYARLYNLGYKNNVIITNEQARPEPVAFKQRRFMYADSAFLSLMDYPMVAGNAETALTEPNKAVISETYARKYFGAEDPIGQQLHMQDDDFNSEIVEVTGVFQDLPANTHLKFDVLFSYSTLFTRHDKALARYDQSWQRKDMYTYLKLRPGTEPDIVAAKLPAIINKYQPDLAEQNRKNIFVLQPLKDIHLTSDLSDEAEPNGDERVVFFMSIISIFVLVIAWINYINLSTARAMERSKEVGIRKVSGAEKRQLVVQFLVESILVNLMAIILAIFLVTLTLPFFKTLSGIDFDFDSLSQTWFLILIPVLWLIGALLSGFYPAWVLSSFRPVSVLKGSLKNTSSGVLLRKALVVIQFTASVILIAGTIIIYRQLEFMLNKDIGMNIDQVMVIERPGIAEKDRNAYNSAIDVFRAELAKNPAVEAAATSFTIPGKQRAYKSGVKKLGAPDDDAAILRVNSMDYDFLDVFQMQLIAGRGFSPDFPGDTDTSVVITNASVRLLGFDSPEDAVGQTLVIEDFGWSPIVVGVVNDYHQVSLQEALEPSIFFCTLYGGEYYSLRIKTNELESTIEQVRQAWTTAFPGNPLDYFFLDDYFNNQYQNERRFGSLASVFALMAILVGCLGLFGLSGFMISQRTKEIGIRKVLGATTVGLIGLLSRDILRLVLIAVLIATPLAWWVMNQWLNNFAYRIDIDWWIFALAGMLTIGLAFLTVSFQSIKAAFANPIESLKSE